MSRIRDRDTTPERVLRRLVRTIGVDFRRNVARLPGKPDLVVPSARAVIFMHGCFWHRHRAKGCKLARLPKSRLDFWQPKLEANRRRDRRTADKLRRSGWHVITIWECQLKQEDAVKQRLRRFLEE